MKKQFSLTVLAILLIFFSTWPTAARGKAAGNEAWNKYIGNPQEFKNVLLGGMFTSQKDIENFVRENPFNPVNREPWDHAVAFGMSQDGTPMPIVFEVHRVATDNLNFSLFTDYEQLRNIKAEYLVSFSNGNDVAYNAIKFGYVKAEHWVLISPPSGYQGKVNSMLDTEVKDIKIFHTEGDMVVSTFGKNLLPGLSTLGKWFDVRLGLNRNGDEFFWGARVDIPRGEGNKLNPSSIQEVTFKKTDSGDPYFKLSEESKDKNIYFVDNPHALKWEFNNIALYFMNNLEKAYNRNPMESSKPKIEQEMVDYCSKFPDARNKLFANWGQAEVLRDLPPKVMELVPAPPSTLKTEKNLTPAEPSVASKNSPGAIPNYWTSKGRPGALTEAEVMTAFARGKDRVLIVGAGPEAQLMYDQVSSRLGRDHVKWVRDPLGWQQEAGRYKADVVLGLKDTAPRLELPAAGAGQSVINRDKFGPPPPPPPPPPPGGSASGPVRKDGGNGPPPAQSPLPSGNIGGVMLAQAAAYRGSGNGPETLTQGDFSLILHDPHGGVDVATLRRFVTALWAVYFSSEGPGISIDPIAPGAKKHLVRYIGAVVNSDLGRVTREADYLMKKLATGSEKSLTSQLKSVDALSNQHGLNYLGASRRFWFVPEAMTFTQAGNALVWQSGYMQLRTEYLVQNKKVKAEPADEAFARYFTEHYQELSREYPIYGELWEYARLVSLCQYLKEKKLPLLWFLLANKELVMTEDSPGTVDAIIKASEYLPGIQIEGGVDLAWKSDKGRYVLDQTATQELQKALAVVGGGQQRPAWAATRETVTFKVKEGVYSATPSQSLSLGQGSAEGGNYRTDLNLRQGESTALELVRYFNPQHPEPGIFGPGWHLMIPYQVEPKGEGMVAFKGGRVRRSLAVRNLLNGRLETLTFSPDRYRLAGYVPPDVKHSQTIGLFPLTDGSTRLVDKLGNEFQFNAAGKMTEMCLSRTYRVQIDYHQGLVPLSPALYQVEPEGPERQQVLNAMLPAKMKVTDLLRGESEVLHLGQQQQAWGYQPAQPGASKYRFLNLRTDGSFQLRDRAGREFLLDASGDFVGLWATPSSGLVKSLRVEKDRVVLDYGVNPAGQVCVISARLLLGDKEEESSSLTYCYDTQGKVKEVIGPEQQVTARIRTDAPRLLACRGKGSRNEIGGF